MVRHGVLTGVTILFASLHLGLIPVNRRTSAGGVSLYSGLREAHCLCVYSTLRYLRGYIHLEDPPQNTRLNYQTKFIPTINAFRGVE